MPSLNFEVLRHLDHCAKSSMLI